jgi:hypothetical protein
MLAVVRARRRRRGRSKPGHRSAPRRTSRRCAPTSWAVARRPRRRLAARGRASRARRGRRAPRGRRGCAGRTPRARGSAVAGGRSAARARRLVGGDVGHERQAREVVPRQEALGREVAVRVEVARLGARPLLEEVELIDRLRVAALRGALLGVGRGVVVHRAARRVALLLGGDEEVAPAVEGLVEALGARRPIDLRGEGVASRVPGREPRARGRRRAGRARAGCGAGPPATRGQGHGSSHVVLQGALGIAEHEQLGDRRVERLLGAGEPDGLEVALDEVAVGEVEERRAHLAVHHRLGSRKKY